MWYHSKSVGLLYYYSVIFAGAVMLFGLCFRRHNFPDYVCGGTLNEFVQLDSRQFDAI